MLTRHASADAFLAAAGDFLRAQPIYRGLPLSVAHQVAADPARYEPPYWFATVSEAGEVVAAALRTPPFNALISDGPRAAVEALAADAVDVYEGALPGVLGPVEASRAFADACAPRMGMGAEVEVGMRQRLFQIDAVRPPREAPGSLRPAEDADLPTLEAWTKAFHVDAGVPMHGSAAAIVERVRTQEALWVWEDERPVSMLAVFSNDPSRTAARLALVYTPAELRGRGYASNAVAEISGRLLSVGVQVGLVTDLANPTSNHIYQAVGYRPVGDLTLLTLTARGPRPPS